EVPAPIRDRVIARAVDRQMVGLLLPGRQPIPLEECALVGLWSLLIERRPLAGTDGAFDPLQGRNVIPLRPKRRAVRRDGWKLQDRPFAAIFNAALKIQQPARKVILVPAGLNQDDGAARHQAGEERRPVPIPDPLPLQLAIGISPVLERIVYQAKMRAAAGGRRANASGEVGSAFRGVHPIRGPAVL